MSVIGDSLLDRSTRNVAAPAEKPKEERPRFGVIEGGLDRAARIARALGTTLLITFIVGLVGALAVHATIIQNQRGVDEHRARIAEIEADTEALRHELAELEAPARIVGEARELGMIDAPEVTYLQTHPGLLDERTLIVAENQLRAG